MKTAATAPHMVPLHLSGNTTDRQNQLLQNFLNEAVREAYNKAVDQMDQVSAQAVLDTNVFLKREIADRVAEILHQHTVSDKYKDEEVRSTRIYPPTYKVRSIEAQVTELRKFFPSLGACQEKLARRPLPEGAEAWFAIPRWQAIAPSYNEAVDKAIEALGTKRRVSNRIIGKTGNLYLCQSERTKLAESILTDQQPECDILVVAGQAGMLHRGASARRIRVSMAGNEFGFGTFGVAAMLLTHPERLSSTETLMIDCSGDEYSARGDRTFDRVPLFDYDLGGIDFSIFYEDRARNLWGTPTGFLYKVV